MPVADNNDWVPDDFAVCGLRGCGGEDAEKTNDSEDEWNDYGLDILCVGGLRVPRKVGNVESQGGIVAQDAVQVCETLSELAVMRV